MLHEVSWIECPSEIVSPVIERFFSLKKPETGKLWVTGLGYFTIYVNGNRISEDRFVPALSDYEQRDMRKWTYPIFDETTHRIYYRVYDVTSFLKAGENRLEIQLGPGWYVQKKRLAEGRVDFGDRLKACYRLEIKDDGGSMSLTPDGSELCRNSHIRFSNLFVGETLESVDEVQSREWLAVKKVAPPDSILEEQTFPADRIIRTLQPALILEKEGKRIFDCGENITGRVCVRGGGKCEQNTSDPIEKSEQEKTKNKPKNKQAEDKNSRLVQIRFSEEIDVEKRELDFHSSGSSTILSDGKPQIQEDQMYFGETSEVLAPEYVWHAFRYFEITGNYEELWVEVIHTPAEPISSFQCDNEILNWIHEAYVRTQLDNLHGCIPSDCPHRERLGYTGDGQITAKAAMMTLDMHEIYRKWIRDILDCQDKISGHVQHTAPMLGGGGGPGGWGCAMVIVPHEYYLHYGDQKLLEQCYPAMKAWISYLKSHCTLGILEREEEKGWCLGDWVAPGGTLIPESFVNTCYLLDALRRMHSITGILKLEGDADDFLLFADRVKQAVMDRFYDPQTGSFCQGIQGADAFAIWAGLDQDPRTKENLVRHYQETKAYDTGFLGTQILTEMLLKLGEYDLVFEMLTGQGPISFENMRRHGATTIWETWEGKDSHNHPMFGGLVRHFYEDFLGIRQKKDSVGYETLYLEPHLPSALHRMEGRTRIPAGEIRIRMERKERNLVFTAVIPVTRKPVVLKYQGKVYSLHVGENALTIST